MADERDRHGHSRPVLWADRTAAVRAGRRGHARARDRMRERRRAVARPRRRQAPGPCPSPGAGRDTRAHHPAVAHRSDGALDRRGVAGLAIAWWGSTTLGRLAPARFRRAAARCRSTRASSASRSRCRQPPGWRSGRCRRCSSHARTCRARSAKEAPAHRARDGPAVRETGSSWSRSPWPWCCSSGPRCLSGASCS